jgi:carbamoyl-phosphate synthase large subunit
LRERYGDSVFVIAIDTNPRGQVAASLFSDAFEQVPLARSPEFAGALARLAEAYPGSCYLPIHDEEIEAAARLAAEGRLPSGLELIAPPYEVVRICNDKWLMHLWLQANGFPTANTVLLTPGAMETLEFPVILKPRVGTGSQGVRLISEHSQLDGLPLEEWLLQQELREPEMAVDVFLSRTTGCFHSACRVFLGSTGYGPKPHGPWRVFHDPVAAAQAEELATRLPLFGAFFFQAFLDASSRWLITDVNPRVAHGTRLSAAAGADFTIANLADFWGEPTDRMLQPIIGEYVVSREYVEYVISAPVK